VSITFPTSPTLGQTYTSGSTTWVYVSHGWRLSAGSGTGGGGGVGPAGLSAYEIAVEHGFVGTEADWLASLQGADGTDGAPGAGIVLQGTLASTADLPGTGSAGDAYIIAGHIWSWNATSSVWVDGGNIQGPAGADGTNGTNGTNGAAATVAVGTVTTGSPGSSAAVTNTGTSSAAVLAFTIPRGATGSAASVAVGSVTTGAAGSSATVTNSGSSTAAILDFVLPRGDTGAPGSGGGLAGMVDVVADYGADPNGVTLSTTAFVNARNSGAAIVWVPPGTYKIGDLTWDDEVGLWGPGSRYVTIKAAGSNFGLTIRPSSGGARIALRGFTLDGSLNTQASTRAGILIMRKVLAEDVVVTGFNGAGARYAPYDASTTDGTGGTVGNAVFFSRWLDCTFSDNGTDGVDVRMGANDSGFINCQFIRNGSVGYHHRTDGGATYGNWVHGGQASYCSSYGYHWESGTDVKAWGLYSEYNGSPTNTNTDGYTNTPYDIFVGDNTSRSEIDCGVLFNGSASHVRAPAAGLNDSCFVKAGGDRLFGSTKSHMPYRVASPSNCTAATVADVVSYINSTLLAKLRTNNTFS
jgi:hypothetical protein